MFIVKPRDRENGRFPHLHLVNHFHHSLHLLCQRHLGRGERGQESSQVGVICNLLVAFPTFVPCRVRWFNQDRASRPLTSHQKCFFSHLFLKIWYRHPAYNQLAIHLNFHLKTTFCISCLTSSFLFLHFFSPFSFLLSCVCFLFLFCSCEVRVEQKGSWCRNSSRGRNTGGTTRKAFCCFSFNDATVNSLFFTSSFFYVWGQIRNIDFTALTLKKKSQIKEADWRFSLQSVGTWCSRI